MKKYIKLIGETIYNFLIGFWTPFNFLLAIAFMIDDDDGVGIYMSFISIIIYLFLLIPNNIIFLKNQKNKKIEKIFIVISFMLGILFAIFFHNGAGIISPLGVLIMLLLNVLFLFLNKKTDLLYIILLVIIDIIFIFFTLKYFNII